MVINLGAVQQAIQLFQVDSNNYAHEDMGIKNDKATELMQCAEAIVFGFLEIDNDEQEDPWEVVDCVNALIQEVRNREGYLSEAEKLFFIMHGYSILMDNLEHITVVDFNLN